MTRLMRSQNPFTELASTRLNVKPVLQLMIVTSFIFATCIVHAWAKGKPQDPEPVVGYTVTFLGTLGGEKAQGSAMNNSGTIVGWSEMPNDDRHAFVLYPEVDSATGDLVFFEDRDEDGLNDLMLDLNDGFPVQGWTAISANDINESDAIVGIAENGRVRRVFHFDVTAGQIFLLPPVDASDTSYAYTAINQQGDIVARRTAFDGTRSVVLYRSESDGDMTCFDLAISAGAVDVNDRVNGQLQVTSSDGYRLTVSTAETSNPVINVDDFPLLHINAINVWGEFCGSKTEVGKGKNKDPGGAFRYWPSMDAAPRILIDYTGPHGREINDDHDVIVSPCFLYHEGTGLLSLKRDLIVNHSGAQIFDVYGMTDRDETGYPKICGFAIDHGAFVVVPFLNQ